MTDYAAAAVQPIVQGLLTVSGAVGPAVPHTPTFSGRGVSAVSRTALGVYLFTLDAGLPGNAGETSAVGAAYALNNQPGAGSGASSTTNVPAPNTRSALTVRGSSGAAPAGATTITSIGITWLTPGADGAFTQFQLVFTAAGVAVDPSDAVAAGCEIVIWKQQPAV